MTDPDPYQPANRVRWNELAPIHYRSAFYDVARFKAGHSRLDRTDVTTSVPRSPSAPRPSGAWSTNWMDMAAPTDEAARP